MNTKRINKEIKKYSQVNFTFENFIIKPKLNDTSIWYFMIYNLQDTVYSDGIYIGKIILPKEYPFKAPDFVMLSDTGRFIINEKICTTFSSFHNETFSPSWTIETMCRALVSFMINPGESTDIGYLYSTSQQKKQIALESQTKIKNHEIYKKYFV